VNQQEINLKGAYSMIHNYIIAQPSTEAPTGTVINVSSGRAGITTAGGSAYNINKLAEQRLSEHVHVGKLFVLVLYWCWLARLIMFYEIASFVLSLRLWLSITLAGCKGYCRGGRPLPGRKDIDYLDELLLRKIKEGIQE
jgi:hypothetical protein